MKLVGRWDFGDPPIKLEVKQAVARTLTSRDGEGRLEDTEYGLQSQNEFLCTLVQVLTDKGILVGDDLLLLLCGGFRVVDE